MNNLFHNNKAVIVLELAKNYTLLGVTWQKKIPYYSVSVQGSVPFRNVLSFPNDLSY